MSAHCNACGDDLSYTDDGGLVCTYCEMEAERDALRQRVAELEHPSGVLEGESLANAYARVFRERDALRKELDHERQVNEANRGQFHDLASESITLRAQLDDVVNRIEEWSQVAWDSPAGAVTRANLRAWLARYQENQPPLNPPHDHMHHDH